VLNVWNNKDFLLFILLSFIKMFLKEASSAHQGCIYLISSLWNIITI